jgi:hypothetical protein
LGGHLNYYSIIYTLKWVNDDVKRIYNTKRHNLFS